MSYWVELRCDVRANGCLSHTNDGPTAHVANIQTGERILKTNATKDGWNIGQGKHVCPNCKEK